MIGKSVPTLTIAVLAFLGAGAVRDTARSEEQTTVYIQTTIPLDKGKPTVTGGASYSQTRGNTTTTVDVNSNGKNLNITGSQSNSRR